ncbi:family 20 glycosylhydrolase [Lachnoclostridium sp. Marseille-P6806]|uniref:family 20 glycosylhydrolase n=1 Tax=Lachnoclostridium sp. Marseille-P6806 TaxID=2364793 RepID=UPI0010321225|nr:family 20 glycosylhydrolase [Lachnoclostridium sp. Marseille-P6806]
MAARDCLERGQSIVLGEGHYVSVYTKIRSGLPIIEELLSDFGFASGDQRDCYESIRFVKTISCPEECLPADAPHLPERIPEEGCVTLARGNTITIYYADDRGAIYGAMELIRLADLGRISELIRFDAPICPERGVKVFVPARKDLDFFRKFVDILVYFKFNLLMIEIGGAMEYRRHPEINEGWRKYCEEMREYSGKTKVIQDETFPWYKNAIHMENGGGDCLTQEELRELADFCKERKIEMIPEIPALGHCDYLLMGNEDIAERRDDPYPDTYCPSNPKSYQLLFDVIDEVAEVFRPKMINIGHDEYYTIGICEQCRKKKAEDIFADDVNKTAAYLKQKGIETMIWGDKLLKNACVPGAGPFGGAEIKMYFPAFHVQDGQFVGIMPATFGAIKKIDHSVRILHWCWPLGEELEDELLAEGLNIRYGNFDSYLFCNWKQHIGKTVHGALISNWSSLNEVILQRNGIFFNIAYACRMFWNGRYEEADFDREQEEAFENLYQLKNPDSGSLKRTEKGPGIRYVEAVFGTDYAPEFVWFVDGVFPEKEKYEIAALQLSYTDGSRAELPIVYGENIGNINVSWGRRREPGGASYTVDDRLIELSYGTLPVRMGEKTYYRYLFQNPFPEKSLCSAAVAAHQGYAVYVQELSFLA